MCQFRSIGVIVLVCAFFFIAMLQALKKYNGNFSGFLHISEQFAARNPFLNRNEDILNSLRLVRDTGYDGQLYYSMCFDPLLRSYKKDPVFYKNVVDVIPYRYTRIGYSLLTSIISNQINFPGTMVLALLFFLALGAFFFNRILLIFNKSPLWTLTYAAVPGLMFALCFATPEPIALALVLGGLFFYFKNKTGLAVLFFALALIMRETVAIVIFAVSITEVIYTKNLKRASILFCSLISIVVWKLYLLTVLWDTHGWSSIYFNVGNVGVPYKGVIELYLAIFHGQYLRYITPAGIIFPALVSVMMIVSAKMFHETKSPLPLACVAYSLLILSCTYSKIWIHIANAERTSYELFCLFFLSVVMTERHHKVGYLCLGIAVVYSFLLGAVHHEFRLGLMPWRLL